MLVVFIDVRQRLSFFDAGGNDCIEDFQLLWFNACALSTVCTSDVGHSLRQLRRILVSILKAVMPIWTVVADIRRIIELATPVRYIAAASGSAVITAAAHTDRVAIFVGTDALLFASTGILAIVVQIKRTVDVFAVPHDFSGHRRRIAADFASYFFEALSCA